MSEDGFHFETDGIWDAKAAVENTLILGESGELVVGGCASITAGISIDLFLLDLLEVFLGFRQVLSYLDKYHFSTEENEVTALKEEVTNHKTEIATGAKIKAIEAEVKAVKDKVDAAGAAWDTHEGKYNLVVDQSKACVKKAYVTGAKEEVVATVTQALAEQKKTLGVKTKMVGEQTTAVAEKTTTLGAHMETAAQSLRNVASETQMHTEATEASTLFFTI